METDSAEEHDDPETGVLQGESPKGAWVDEIISFDPEYVPKWADPDANIIGDILKATKALKKVELAMETFSKEAISVAYNYDYQNYQLHKYPQKVVEVSLFDHQKGLWGEFFKVSEVTVDQDFSYPDSYEPWSDEIVAVSHKKYVHATYTVTLLDGSQVIYPEGNIKVKMTEKPPGLYASPTPGGGFIDHSITGTINVNYPDLQQKKAAPKPDPEHDSGLMW